MGPIPVVVAARAELSVPSTLPRSCLTCIHGLPPVLLALITTLEVRDPYTAGHSRRVMGLSLQLGTALGLSVGELERLRIAAQLHDVGKIGVRDAVLHKAGVLTSSEYAEMREHAAIGARIVGAVFPELEEIVLYHHEHVNGRGYFARIGMDIPLLAQIIALCDSYDAMISDRPYRAGMSSAEVTAILTLDEGNQWDTQLVACLLGVLQQQRWRDKAMKGDKDIVSFTQ